MLGALLKRNVDKEEKMGFEYNEAEGPQDEGKFTNIASLNDKLEKLENRWDLALKYVSVCKFSDNIFFEWLAQVLICMVSSFIQFGREITRKNVLWRAPE